MEYYPPPRSALEEPTPTNPEPEKAWVRKRPEAVGMDGEALREAVRFARVNATPKTQVTFDFSGHERRHEVRSDHWETIGPMPERRGDSNGLVLRDGFIVAEWGDVALVDHSFSVTKSVLSVLAGLAIQRGLIGDVTDRVARYVDDGGFDSTHNESITWEHLLQQTSEWEGTLFGKPDTVDRNRPVGKRSQDVSETGDRPLRPPGTYWEYNDVRINRLALSLLRVWKKPLPLVLKHEVLEPIGASDRWEWHGYHNSDVMVGDRRIKSIAGGGHWGGGLWIDSLDLARVGHLLLGGGTWDGTHLVSEGWIDESTTPCEQKSTYGYLWWLNTDRKLWPSSPSTSYAAIGLGGTNLLWIDPEHDLVVVCRWLAKAPDQNEREDFPVVDSFLERLLDSIERRSTTSNSPTNERREV